MKSVEDFKDLLSKLSSYLSATEEEDRFIVSCEETRERWDVKKDDIRKLIEKINKKKIKDETILYDNYSYEAPVKLETPFPLPLGLFFREKYFPIKDSFNNIEYELSKPTNEYLLFILHLLKGTEYWRRIFKFLPKPLEKQGAKEKLEFFEFLKEITRIYTLKVKSHERINSKRLSDLAISFLFTLSYNLDVAIIEIRFVHEISHYGITKMIRSDVGEIEPPYRIYDSDLVHHYHRALSTDSVPLKFLSFYHVAEHFFYDVFYEDLINEIKDKITGPGFSYKRNSDLKKLIDLIRRKTNFKGKEINEEMALYLTLKRYVDLKNLKSKLLEYDDSLVDYYKNNKVSFSGADIIDFSLDDSDKIFKQTSKRVYKTRNSIVHSKEGVGIRYVPFRHDKDLMMEIPLIRFIAEEIIINSSKVLSKI